MSIDSECQLLRIIDHSFLKPLIDRRKRKLFSIIEEIRLQLASKFNHRLSRQ